MLFFYSSCTCYKRESFKYENVKNPWINSYKEYVFIECVKQSYNNDSILFLFPIKDLLNTYDGIAFTDIESAKSLGQKVAINIPDPSYKFDDYQAGQKYYVSSCLRYYASSELDSIALVEYKKFIKRTKQ